MGKAPDLSDYVEVADRMAEFFKLYPDGSFDSECQFTQIGDRWIAIVKAYAYRDRQDPRPGVGLAAEYIPGRTPYTKDSELENAQTSAIGRAILSVGAATSKRIASYEEVRNRTAEPDNVINNLKGRQALRDVCEEKGLDPRIVAARFRKDYGHDPKVAQNDELISFVNLIKSGMLDPDPEPAPA